MEFPQESAEERAQRSAALRDLKSSMDAFRPPAEFRHAQAVIDSMLRGCTLAMTALMTAQQEVWTKAKTWDAEQAAVKAANAAAPQRSVAPRRAAGEAPPFQ